MLKVWLFIAIVTTVTGIPVTRETGRFQGKAENDQEPLGQSNYAELKRLEDDERLIAQLRTDVNQLMRDNEKLHEENNKLHRENNEIHDKLQKHLQENGDVIFYVHLSNGNYEATEGAIIQYDVIVTNLGDGYNPASAAFTAPQNGYYYFTIFYQTASGTGSDLAIMVNNNMVCRGDAVSSTGNQGTCTAVVELQAGGVVNVKAVYGNAVLYGNEDGLINGFAGFLYYAL